jgi:hypothetical protein
MRIFVVWNCGQKWREMIVGCITDCVTLAFDRGAQLPRTHRTLKLNMLIYSPRIGHILEHHLANLQRGFSKANLENLQIPTLSMFAS